MVSHQHLRALRDIYANRGDDGSSSSSALLNTTASDDDVFFNDTTTSRTTAPQGVVNSDDPYALSPQFSSRSGNDPTTMVLFILFVMFSLCLIFMRLSCCYNRNNEADGQGPHHRDPSFHVRTKEAIEKMLVLKKVLAVGDPMTNDNNKTSSSTTNDGVEDDLVLKKAKSEAKITKRIERRKSNLLLPSGSGDTTIDELDQSRSCPICLGDYQNGESICWSNNKECFHRFHATCGIAWLSKHSECPVCRAEYLVEPPASSSPTAPASSSSDDDERDKELKKTTSGETDNGVSSIRTNNPIVIIEEDDNEEEGDDEQEPSNNDSGDDDDGDDDDSAMINNTTTPPEENDDSSYLDGEDRV